MSSPKEGKMLLGRSVVYRGSHPNAKPEQGVVSSYNHKYIFVRYDMGSTAAATDPADLTFLNGDPLEPYFHELWEELP